MGWLGLLAWVLGALGMGWVVGFITSRPLGGGVVGVLLAGVALFFCAAYRLQEEIDERNSKKPLVVLHPRKDGDWWILPVENDNTFATKGAYALLRVYRRAGGSRPTDQFPPIDNFYFPWSSYASNKQARVRATIGRMTMSNVGIALHPQGGRHFYTPRLSYVGKAQQERGWPLEEGEYDVEIDVGANEIDPVRVALHISFSSEHGLVVTKPG
ncbi:MAG: hypothetical protein AB7N70_17595 [Dehalococcoidia bacterium]